MSMESEFEHGMDDEILSSCVEKINNIWNKYGCPYPNQTTTTEVAGMRPYCDDMEPDDQDVVDKYNMYVDQIYSLIDVFHIGSGIWYTHVDNPDEWDQYSEDATEIIQEFIAEYLWGAVCMS